MIVLYKDSSFVGIFDDTKKIVSIISNNEIGLNESNAYWAFIELNGIEQPTLMPYADLKEYMK